MRAIKIYIDMHRFTIMAKYHISIAAKRPVVVEKAIAHYKQSAEDYKGEESNSLANKVC